MSDHTMSKDSAEREQAAKLATPPEELRERLMSAGNPKSELEWFAHHEIAALREQLATMSAADNDTWTRGHDAGHEAGWAAAMEAAAKVCEHYSHGHHKAGHSVLALGRNAAEEIRRLAAQPAQPEPCKTCGGKPRGVLHPDGGWVPCPACQQPKPCGACYRSPYPDNPCESCVFQCWTPNHHPTQPVREYCSHDPLPEGLINVYFDSPWNAKVDPHGSCGYFKPDWQRAEEDAELQGPDCQQPEQEGETK